MKRYALISAILLVAFMWSCQDQVSSPYAPEDLATLATDGGDGTVTTAAKPEIYSGTFKVDVYFGGAVVPDGTADNLGFGKRGGLVKRNMSLDLEVVANALGVCIKVGTYTGTFAIVKRISFYFPVNDVHYQLRMAETVIPAEGVWPPALNDTTTFTGGSMYLAFDRGKGGRKNSCEGEVLVPWRVEVTRTK